MNAPRTQRETRRETRRETEGESILVLRIKAVPGASRDAIAGMLGDRVKVRISAPPEGGRANKSIVRLLAKAIGVKPDQIELISGHGGPEKRIAMIGVDARGLCDALGFDASDAIERKPA